MLDIQVVETIKRKAGVENPETLISTANLWTILGLKHPATLTCSTGLIVARNQRRGITVCLFATLKTFDTVATGHYRQHESCRNRYRWLQVICYSDGDQRVGRELQFHHRSQRQWEIEYSRRNMLCPRHYEHEHRQGAEYPSKSAAMFLRDVVALIFPGLDLQTRPSRRDQGQRNNRLRQPRQEEISNRL